jgi:GAF domain-containing protein
VALATNERLIDVLHRTASVLVDELDADACAVSRVIGDVLLLVTEVSTPGKPIELERGFLVSEFPDTQHVLFTGEPRALHVGQAGIDPAEAALLHEMGYEALLMLPLVLQGETWGLVEVYREDPRPFGAVEERAAAALLAELAQ